MNRGFYPRLAWTGMKQNRRLYLPYLLTCTGVTAMFYILMGLSVSSVLPQMSGGRSTALIMSLGSVVIAFFALIFLFYTHSFLIRRRSREFGLYNVLGMGKGNIARILLWETLLSCGATTLIGLALGILLSKLAEAALLKLLHLRVAYTFTVSIPSLLLTLGLFAAIHALIFLRSLWELHRVSAVALLRSESVGEKPPRARWALAVLGVGFVALGVWFESFRIPVNFLFPLGLRAQGFYCGGDYFPLLPGFGWFLLGAVIGRTAYRKKQSLLPRVNAANPVIRFFSFCGRHSLLIYMLHQPVLTIGTILIFG